MQTAQTSSSYDEPARGEAPCRAHETASTMVESLAKMASPPADVATPSHSSAAAAASYHQHPAAANRQQEETVFSTIGLGILPDFCRTVSSLEDDSNSNETADERNNGEDATEAACKAIQDAMERGVLAFTSSQQQQHHHQQPPPQLSIRIGVPLKLSSNRNNNNNNHGQGGGELMQVDQFKVMAQLNSLQQRGVELKQIETVAGGLWAQQHHNNNGNECRGILSVVACLSVVKLRRAPTPPPAPVAATTTVAQQQSAAEQQHSLAAAAVRNATSPTSVTVSAAHYHPAPPAIATATTAAASLTRLQPPKSTTTTSSSNNMAALIDGNNNNSNRMQIDPPTTMTAATAAADHPVTPSSYGDASTVLAAAPPAAPFRDFHRSSSMDVLARVSAEIRDMQPSVAAAAQHQQQQVQQQQQQLLQDTLAANNNKASNSNVNNNMADAYADKYGNNTNYKKLPPGKTPKNNKRLFVKHSYRDFSTEQASSDEKALLQDRTPNAAFPLKLHETLSEIERDGHDDIIGWLSHGRSFKIHKQQEFVEQILPKYFVMTKKSSFLRQLNLYGFNRLSGVGPDQGSYYHEAFLRGMKFLCRRMQRIKVNGNRIRAAGNPDEEPVLSNYPTCPRTDAPQATTAAASAVSEASNTHNLATAAVLQLMASQRAAAAAAPVAPAPAPRAAGISPLFGLVPGSAAANAALLAAAPTPAEVATLLASRNAVAAAAALPSSLALHSSLSSPTLLESQVSEVVPKTKQDRSSSMSSSSSAGTNGNSNTNNSPGNAAGGGGGGGGGNSNMVSFPLKLQRILDKLEAEGHDSVLSWLPHGRAFVVKNSDRLVNELMPLHFNQTKYSSFQRQLHMYNFQRITTGRDKGAYHHPQFLRGQPLLCQKMGRTRVNGKGTRQPGNPQTEPDFYQLAPLPRIPVGVSVEIPQQMIPPTANASSTTNPNKRSSAPSVSSSSGGPDSEEER